MVAIDLINRSHRFIRALATDMGFQKPGGPVRGRALANQHARTKKTVT